MGWETHWGWRLFGISPLTDPLPISRINWSFGNFVKYNVAKMMSSDWFSAFPSGRVRWVLLRGGCSFLWQTSTNISAIFQQYARFLQDMVEYKVKRADIKPNVDAIQIPRLVTKNWQPGLKHFSIYFNEPCVPKRNRRIARSVDAVYGNAPFQIHIDSSRSIFADSNHFDTKKYQDQNSASVK